MGSIGKGLAAGLVATIVLSIIMVIKAQAGLLPAFNAIQMIAGILGAPLIAGWIGHFAIGVVLWGVLFALLYPMLPGGNGMGKGLVFGVLAWLAMMIIFMPVAGAGFFGLAIGLPVVVATLVLHLIYGAVLGATYAALGGGSAARLQQAR